MGLPNITVIEFTNKCNLQCTMCARNLMKRPVGTISLLLATKIFQQIPKRFFWTHGFGEPLLHPRFSALVSMAKMHGHRVGAITNATVLNREMGIKIIASGLDELVFSIDGPRHIFNQIRIGADYDQIKKNIRDFLGLRNELKIWRPKLRINLVAQADNKAWIPDFVEEWKPIIPNIRVKNINDYFDGDPEKEVPSDLFHDPRKGVCYALHRGGIMITWDGRVVPCCTMYDAQWVYGDLNEQTFQEIWDGPSRKALLSLHKSGDYPPVCRWCHRDQRQSRDV